MARLRVRNHAKLGDLIRKWARGEIERPGSVPEFLSQANEHGAGVDVIDGRFKDIAFTVQPASDVLHVQLPHVSALDEMDAAAEVDGTYDLPDFYDRAYQEGQGRRAMRRSEKSVFRIARLGDYCIQKCH